MTYKSILFISIILGLYCNPKVKIDSNKKAIKTAKKRLIKTYGIKVLKEKPFKAKLINDSIWIIKGSLPEPDTLVNGNDTSIIVPVGGVAIIHINKYSGETLYMTHEK